MMKTLTTTQTSNPWYDLTLIYMEMELELVKSLKRNLSKHIEDEKKEGFKYEMWQAAKLRNIESFRRENKEIIQPYRPIIEKIIENSIIESYDRGVNKVVREFKELGDKSINIELPTKIEPIIAPNNTPLTEGQENILENSPRVKEDVFFKSDNDKIKAIIDEAKRTVEKPTSSILRYEDDIYRQILFKTQLKLAHGTITLDQAIDEATKEFLNNGIANIRYKDGKSVNIADYVTMCLRTANHKAFLTGQGEKRKELGVTTVLVSQHGTACPLCIPWQNEVLIDDVFSGGTKGDGPYKLVSTAMSAGLLHVNCMHDLLTYFEGITKKPKTVDSTTTEEKYKVKQELRRLERAIRKQKRVVAGTVNLDNFNRENAKLKVLEKRYKDFFDKNKEFKPDKNRLKIDKAEKESLNESSVKISDDYSNKVDLNYIKSEEFKNKFNSITDNEKVNREIYKRSKTILEHRNGTDKEDLCIINATTGELVALKSNNKKDLEVHYDKKLLELIKNNPQNTFISIHNHPNNLLPTGSDFVSCGAKGYAFGIVVGHDGSIYKYKSGNIGFRKEFIDTKVEKMHKISYNITYKEAQLKVIQEFIKSHNIVFKEV